MGIMRRLMAFAIVVAAAVPTLGGQTRAPRTVLLVVDASHIDVRQTPRLRRFPTDLTRGARDVDTWALVTTGSPALRVAPSLGGAGVRAAVVRITGNAPTVREQLDAFGDPDRAAIVRRRTLLTDIVVAQAVSDIAESQAAPLSIVFVSDGYDARLVPEMSELVRAAAEARARLVAVSVRDLVSAPEPPPDVRADEWSAYIDATRQSLRTLAEQTGGTAVFSRDAVGTVIAEIAEAR